jgi:pyruvate formate lyase activating enzyme
MDIRGLTRFSLIDYPGKMACVAFVAGCNFRCPFCQNPTLVLHPETQPPVTPAELYDFLDRRRGKLDAVVFSGGEPTLYPDLADVAAECRARGFLVKVDTNGSNPELIRRMIATGALTALAVDYKAPVQAYAEVAGCADPGIVEAVRDTLRAALAADIVLVVRTTVHRDILSGNDLRQIRRELDDLGVAAWTIQQFHPVETLDPALTDRPTFSDRELADLAAAIGGNTRIRGIRLAPAAPADGAGSTTA